MDKGMIFARVVWLVFYFALVALWAAAIIPLGVVTFAAVATPFIYLSVHERASYFMPVAQRRASLAIVKNAVLSMLMASALLVATIISVPQTLYGPLVAAYLAVILIIIGTSIYLIARRSGAPRK